MAQTALATCRIAKIEKTMEVVDSSFPESFVVTFSCPVCGDEMTLDLVDPDEWAALDEDGDVANRDAMAEMVYAAWVDAGPDRCSCSRVARKGTSFTTRFGAASEVLADYQPGWAYGCGRVVTLLVTEAAAEIARGKDRIDVERLRRALDHSMDQALLGCTAAKRAAGAEWGIEADLRVRWIAGRVAVLATRDEEII